MRGILALALLVASIFTAHADASARTFSLQKNGSQSQREYDAQAQQLRAFLWAHWISRSAAEAIVKWSTVEGQGGATRYKIRVDSIGRRIIISTVASEYPPEHFEATMVERGNHALFLKDASGKVASEI
jgi:hypothetical protein